MTDLTHRLEDVLRLQGLAGEPKPETGDDFWPLLESRLGQSSERKSYGTRALPTASSNM
jgi:hypothetical protein